MPAYIWKIILKQLTTRTISEQGQLIEWWTNCTNQELKYGIKIKDAIEY